MSIAGSIAAQRAAAVLRDEWADYIEWRLELFGAEFVVRDEGIRAASIHRRLRRAGRHDAAARFTALASREERRRSSRRRSERAA